MKRWYRAKMKKPTISSKQTALDQETPDQQAHEQPQTEEAPDRRLSTDLEENLQQFKSIFENCSDLIIRQLQAAYGPKMVLLFIEGIVKTEEIHENLLRPLLETVERKHLPLSEMKTASTFIEAADAILTGKAVLLADQSDEAILFNVRGGQRRGIEEPTTESVVRGPREGFTETLRVNTALLRFRIKTPQLKMESFTIGKQTETSVVLSYIEGIADPKAVAEARKRLKKIQIDGILESGYVEELLEDNPYSLFPQFQYTERPDTASAQLLEGKFVIFVEGTPFVLIAPVTVWQLLQSSEDYYERYHIANMLRWLRYMLAFAALFMPGIYVAVTTYHQDMLPTTLILSIASAREAIPFPVMFEALIMEVTFEALREAGIRLPKTVGQTVSILGALVIGQAAVEAGIVSAPMVIVVSMTGIASFTIPRYNLAVSVRILRFPMILLAGVLGLFGLVVGTVLVLAHLAQLKSFGTPYLSGLAPYRKREAKDILVRTPWWNMVRRPVSANDNLQRQQPANPPSPEQAEPW